MLHNPIFESSMKRRMRSYRAPMLLTLYILFMLLVSFMAITTLQQSTVTLGDLRAGLETYLYLSIMQFALIVLVAPALTAGAIAGERERQTLDLLLCTRVGAVRITLGKLFSSVCFLALLIVSSLPIAAVTLFFGGVSIGDMLLMSLFLLVTAIACCAIGLFCSALLKRTVTATVVAYLIVFALGVGTLAFPMLFQTGRIQELLSTYSSSYYYGSGAVSVIGGSGAGSVTRMSALSQLPWMFFLNPAIGLFSLLIEQTGLLKNTLEMFMGYRGMYMFDLFDALGSVAAINMVVLGAISLVLIVLSALLVRPGGRKRRKRK